MSKNFVVEGIAFYPFFNKPNSASNAYGVDLVLDEKNAAVIEALGVKSAKRENGDDVTYEESPGKVFRFKRKAVSKAGAPVVPPTVYDAKGNKIRVNIGNGSRLRVYGQAYEYTKPKPGIACGLSHVQVLKLVEFNNLIIDEDGWEAPDSMRDDAVVLQVPVPGADEGDVF